tara:strand:- start:358 stop:504 length:147 start_codon:yes stop_codon:yes gene_type:complete
MSEHEDKEEHSFPPLYEDRLGGLYRLYHEALISIQQEKEAKIKTEEEE